MINLHSHTETQNTLSHTNTNVFNVSFEQVCNFYRKPFTRRVNAQILLDSLQQLTMQQHLNK